MTTSDGRRLISYDVNGTAIRELVPANSIHSNNERK